MAIAAIPTIHERVMGTDDAKEGIRSFRRAPPRSSRVGDWPTLRDRFAEMAAARRPDKGLGLSTTPTSTKQPSERP